MSAQESRRQIQAFADALAEHRKLILESVAAINAATTKLVEMADTLLPVAVSEGLGEVQVRRIGYKQHAPSPVDIADHEKPKTRICSICKQAGHNARTCPTGRPKSEEKTQ